jgi:hypothetical protein
VTVKHFVEFRADATVVIERGGVCTRIAIRRGAQCPATVRCYVIYRHERYVEVADVEVKEGLLRGLPCSHFMFIDRLG